MKKLKQLAVFTMLTICCALLTGCKYDDFLSATEPCGSDAQWTWNFETGELAITGNGALDSCPWQLKYRDLIKSVTIGEGITSIVDTSFTGCSNITSVTWNAKNCSINTNRNFFGRDSLIESFVFGDKVEVIPTRLCANLNKLTEIIIPNSVKEIENRAFFQCKGLMKVTIGNNVRSIGVRAFSNCSSLQEIAIPNSVTTLGDTAFSYCTQLTNVIIGDGVKEIGQCSFQGCNSLENVTIGSKVTTIKTKAFSACSKLKSITIPDNVKKISIGEYAFSGCSSLIGVPFTGSIGERAFRDCTGLTSMTITGSVGNRAFQNCTGLTHVTISTNLEAARWGEEVFLGCDNITSVVFEEGAYIIPDSVCYGMNRLTTVAFLGEIDVIGSKAFANCASLNSVTCTDSIPTYSPFVCEDAFDQGERKIENLYVPAGSEAAYARYSPWKNAFINILPISE